MVGKRKTVCTAHSVLCYEDPVFTLGAHFNTEWLPTEKHLFVCIAFCLLCTLQ